MKCLLIGGAPSVGKTGTIFRLTEKLISNGFVIVAGAIPSTLKDFKVVLEGKNKLDATVRVIINSASDQTIIIEDFKSFFDSNGNYDLLISSIRDDDFWPRNEFFQIMNLKSETDVTLEIPLAKITRRGDNFETALAWYQTRIDRLLTHVLNNNPFDLNVI